MPSKSSQTADPRRPVYVGRKRVPGLTERTLRDGRTIFEARVRFDAGGPLERVVLDATTKTDAIAELQALRVDRRRGDPVRTSSAVPTVREVSADWLAWFAPRVDHRDPHKRRSPRTLALYRDRMERHVLPTLGNLPINEVGVADLRRLVDRLGVKLAPSTVKADLSMTSALMRFAVKQRLIAHNPVHDLDRDDRPGGARRKEPRYLSADEVALLLSKMTDTFRPVAATAAYAGLRISEVLGLSWADVDFTAKTIDVSKQLDDDGTVRNATKTRASTAQVPMLPALERHLREHRSRQAGISLRLVRRDALVFVTRTGAPQNRRNALRAVHRAAESIGLNREGVKRVGNHDLRHTFVAIAIDLSSIPESSRLARHASPRVTAQIYAGVIEENRGKIAAKLAAGGFGS